MFIGSLPKGGKDAKETSTVMRAVREMMLIPKIALLGE
nr:MAG TPA: hypothetical protein [Herelleviridae sp.]